MTPEGRNLGERNPVSYVPSASVLRYCLSHQRRPLVATVSAADAEPQRPLPFARVQALLIAERFRSALALYGREADEAHVIHALETHPAIIHLALHGTISEASPLDAGLVLADNTLSARSILDIRLGGALVTLCACSTGSSTVLTGDELLGLTRSCLYAGARTLLVTQWSIDDLPAAIFMDRYYELLDEGIGPAGALQRAQIALRTATTTDVLAFLKRARVLSNADDTLAHEITLAEAELHLVAADANAAQVAVRQVSVDAPVPLAERAAHLAAKAALLTRAKATARPMARPFDHPYYWGAFTIVGAWI